MYPVMAFRSKTILIVLGIAAALLMAVVLIVSALLNSDRNRMKVIFYLQERTGKQVEIGKLALTLFPPAIRLDDLGVRNLPLFPPGYVVKVTRVEAEVDPRALLHGHLVIQSLVLENPVVHLISDPDGAWNFESPDARNPEKAFALGVIAKVEIKKGQLVASNLLSSRKPGPVFFEAHDMSGEFAQVDVDAMISPSSISMGGQGSMKADRLGFGAVDAENLSFKLQLWARQVFLADVKADVFGGHSAGGLFFDFSGNKPVFTATVQFNSVSLVHLLEPFENGRGKMTGKIEGELTLGGKIQHSVRPLAGIHGNGHVRVRNGEVPSLKLNENLLKLVRYNNQGPAKESPSSFKLISTDLELADLRIVSKVIDIDGYGVDIDGSGNFNVDGSNELEYQGEARITTKQGFFTNSLARLSGATLKDGQLSFPFRVGGTIGTPIFSRGKGD